MFSISIGRVVCSASPLLRLTSSAVRHHCPCFARDISNTARCMKAKFNMKTKLNRPKIPNISVYETMTIRELADALEKDVKHVFTCLDYLNTTERRRINDENVRLHSEVIHKICEKSGVRGMIIGRPSIDKKIEVDRDVYRRPEPDPSMCEPRPPVVTIMGHVDHGKTTLLDHLRKSNVVDQEFGGITQHIGAFSVKLKNGKSITFLDTPGHAAFSAMRGRGARMTDIIILVVAADDGVMPQTIESINHATQSQVPVVVAVNKCDRVEAEVEACVEDLSLHGVVLEELGGDVMGVHISALKGDNVDALQDAIITQAELLDIKSDPNGLVEGRVIESKTEPGRGKVASLLVQRGTLKTGDFLVSNTCSAKVRGMYDENRKLMKSAGPGSAVEVVGWKELPSPGEEVLQVENESKMKIVIAYRKAQIQKIKEEDDWKEIREKRSLHAEHHMNTRVLPRQATGLLFYNRKLKREMYNAEEEAKRLVQLNTPDTVQLPLIIRADVDGSLEAIESCLATYNSHLCDLDIIASGVGEVTENDVDLAQAFNGVIIAFNTKVSDNVGAMASKSSVTIRRHNIIYKLVDNIKDLLNERIPPITDHRTLGEAVIQKVFYVTEKTDGKSIQIPVAGCRCVRGALYRHALYKVVRGTDVVAVCKLHMLKHFKAEVEDIKENMECGLALSDHSVAIEEGDAILCFEEHNIQPEIDWNLPF